MKNSIYISSFVLGIMLLSSCEKMDVMPNNVRKEVTSESTPDITPVSITTVPCEKTVTNFYAGQHILVGTISVTNDATNIYVTFHTTGGWLMQQTHLYIGPLSGLPVGSNGNPKIGNFPYSSAHQPKITEFTYTIPLNKISSDCIIVAAHAEVMQLSANGSYVNGQTAWGAGKQISSGGSWASYFDYCICQPETGEGNTGDNGAGDGGGTDGDDSTGGDSGGDGSNGGDLGSDTEG